MAVVIDRPGVTVDDLGHLTGEAVRAKGSIVEVRAPGVSVVAPRLTGIKRNPADPQGDFDFPAAIKWAKTATGGRLTAAVFEDIDGLCVDAYADDLVIERARGTGCNGVRFVRCSRGKLIDSAFPLLDRMLRSTPKATNPNDDVGGLGVNFYECPRGPVRHLVENCYFGDARAQGSPDYGVDGAPFELWQSSSIEVKGCVSLDADNVLETGAHGGVNSHLWLHGNVFGATKAGGPYRGLMLRPVQDVLVEDNDYFGFEHWHYDINHGGGSFSGGTTSNLVFRNERHAATRATRPLAQQGTGYVIEPTVVVLTGADAVKLAAAMQARAFARRDAILAVAGKAGAGVPVPPPTPAPDPTVAELAGVVRDLSGHVTDIARLLDRSVSAGAELERRVDQAEQVAAGAVAEIAALGGPFSLLTGRVAALETPRDTAAAKAAIDRIRKANPNIAAALDAVLDVATP